MSEAASNLATAFYILSEKTIVSATACAGRLSVWWCWWRGNALDLGAPCWNLGTCGFDWLLGMLVLGSEMWSSGRRLQRAGITQENIPPFLLCLGHTPSTAVRIGDCKSISHIVLLIFKDFFWDFRAVILARLSKMNLWNCTLHFRMLF